MVDELIMNISFKFNVLLLIKKNYPNKYLFLLGKQKKKTKKKWDNKLVSKIVNSFAQKHSFIK